MDKEILRKALQSKVDSFDKEITLYAPKPLEERKPWKKKPTPLDQQYGQALVEAEAEAQLPDANP